MQGLPWRVPSQTIAVANKDGEPWLSVELNVDPNNAHLQTLRIIPADADAHPVVLTFDGSTCGPAQYELSKNEAEAEAKKKADEAAAASKDEDNLGYTEPPAAVAPAAAAATKPVDKSAPASP